MSENGAKHSPSPNGEKKMNDEELWKKIEIYFELDSDRFSNNTIYGTVCIEPKQARELIGKFFLCNDDSQIHVRVKFDNDAEYIKASGFDPTRKHLVYIEAVPKNENFNLPPKKSKPQELLITRQSFSILPVIDFSWPSSIQKDSKDKSQPSAQEDSTDKLQPSTQEDSKIKLQPVVIIIKWLHIGDTNAEKYVVCLDNKEVRHIRDTVGKHMFEVRIHNFESEKETSHIYNIQSNKKPHVLQIIARLNDGHDTYESDCIKFIVSDKKDGENIIEFISVSKVDKPRDQGPKKKKVLPEITSSADKKSPEPHSPSISQSKKQQKDVETNATCSCCRRPHDRYPGIDHYFGTDYNKPSSPSLSERKTVDRDKRMSCSDKGRTNNNNYARKNKKEHDDNDDVEEGVPLADEQ